MLKTLAKLQRELNRNLVLCCKNNLVIGEPDFFFLQSLDKNLCVLSRCGKTTDHLSLLLLTMAITTITVTLSVITSDSRHLQVQCGCVAQ